MQIGVLSGGVATDRHGEPCPNFSAWLRQKVLSSGGNFFMRAVVGFRFRQELMVFMTNVPILTD
jgi:hypothetical protein